MRAEDVFRSDQLVYVELEILTVADKQMDFSKVRKLTILIFALHHPYSTGYTSGAWVRLLEILKRAKAFNIHYVLTEPSPTFRDRCKVNYESIPVCSNDYEKILGSAFVMLEATIKGIRRAIKRDIDLIVSPIEAPFCVIPAFVTSLITGIPWTAVIHNVPVYSRLPEDRLSQGGYSVSFEDLHQYLKQNKHKGRRTHFVILSTILNYILYKILKTTTIIGVGTAVRDLNIIDKHIRVKEVFPANSIPLNEITKARIEEADESKEYDALFVGGLRSQKGIFDAINAWHLVARKNPSLNLYIVGKEREKGIVKRIEKLIERHNLIDNVHFLFDPLKGAPFVTDVWKSMKKSRILIFPSTIDAWSITVGEALSFGLPVVGYDIFALKHAYGDCEAVIRVPVGDVNQLAAKVMELLENRRQLSKLGRDALQFVRNYYTWNDVVSAERLIYERLLSR